MLTSLRHNSKPSRFLLYPLAFIFSFLLCLPWVSAKETPKPKPQDWQINGIVAALDDGNDQIKKLAFDKLNEYDLKNWPSVVEKPENIAQKAAKILKDTSLNSDIRSSAAYALGNLGEAAKPYVKDIADILKDTSVDSSVRRSAAVILGEIGKLRLDQVVVILDSVYYEGQSEIAKWRFLTYFLGGGTDEVKTLLTWVGKPEPKAIPENLTHAKGVKTLEVFNKAWEASTGLDELRKDLAKQIAVVARKVSWQPQDIVLLQTHYHNLKGLNEADSLQSVIVNLQSGQWFFNARITIISHAAFWLALIFAYPKFPQIQAIFFWNPWVRRILGVGYVGFLLTWCPPFRQKSDLQWCNRYLH